MLIVVGLIVFAALLPFGAIGLVLSFLIGGVPGGILLIIGTVVFNTIVYSFGALAGTLLFFDLRARKGTDVPLPEPGPFGPVPERPTFT